MCLFVFFSRPRLGSLNSSVCLPGALYATATQGFLSAFLTYGLEEPSASDSPIKPQTPQGSILTTASIKPLWNEPGLVAFYQHACFLCAQETPSQVWTRPPWKDSNTRRLSSLSGPLGTALGKQTPLRQHYTGWGVFGPGCSCLVNVFKHRK